MHDKRFRLGAVLGFLVTLRENRTNVMKKLLWYLLVAVMICSMGSVMVSCEKNNDPRDELNPMEVQDPEGVLEINDWDLYLKNRVATLIATYRNANGLYEPEKIWVNPGDVRSKIDGDHAYFEFTVPGSYTVNAGSLSIDIKVMK